MAKGVWNLVQKYQAQVEEGHTRNSNIRNITLVNSSVESCSLLYGDSHRLYVIVCKSYHNHELYKTILYTE